MISAPDGRAGRVGVEVKLGALVGPGYARAGAGRVATAAGSGVETQAYRCGVNVILFESRKPDPVAFVRTGELEDGVRRAAPAQIAVDVLNGPQDGEALLRCMTENGAA